jgi:6-phosphogluconolactonase
MICVSAICYGQGIRQLRSCAVSIFLFDNLNQESGMLKKAAAMFLVFANMAMWVSCVSTSNRYVYAALPAASEIVVYREDPNSGVLTPLSVSPITAGPSVQSIAIHPSKKYLYGANSGENDISLYTTASTGALTEVTRAPAGTTPSLLVMDSAGSYLYVANAGSNNISAFSINASNGVLTPVAGSPYPIGMTPLNMVLSPSGSFLYVTGSGAPGSIEVWSLKAGVLSQIVQLAQTGTNPDGLVIDPKGAHLYTANAAPDNSISEFTINSDGLLSPITTVSVGALSGPVALLIDASGKYLYAANEGASNLTGYSIASDGSLSLLTANYSVVTNAKPSFLAEDPSGKYLFVGNQSNPTIQSFSLDTGTGTLTAVASYSIGNAATSIVVTH